MNDNIKELSKKANQLTTDSGCYLMKSKSGEIIYVGKAKNLKNRVTSYFRGLDKHTPKVAAMVNSVETFETIITASEFEALVLECSLIIQHAPRYNILLKDDKGYCYLKIDGERSQKSPKPKPLPRMALPILGLICPHSW